MGPLPSSVLRQVPHAVTRGGPPLAHQTEQQGARGAKGTHLSLTRWCVCAGSTLTALGIAQLWREKRIKEIERAGVGNSFKTQTPLHLDSKLNDLSEIVKLLQSAESCEASRALAARKAEEDRLLRLPPVSPNECVTLPPPPQKGPKSRSFLEERAVCVREKPRS